MMRVVLFICIALLFASYYFGDRVQIARFSSLCPSWHAEKVERNDHSDPLVPDIEESRDYDECVVDDCYEPDSDPDMPVFCILMMTMHSQGVGRCKCKLNEEEIPACMHACRYVHTHTHLHFTYFTCILSHY